MNHASWLSPMGLEVYIAFGLSKRLKTARIVNSKLKPLMVSSSYNHQEYVLQASAPLSLSAVYQAASGGGHQLIRLECNLPHSFSKGSSVSQYIQSAFFLQSAQRLFNFTSGHTFSKPRTGITVGTRGAAR